MLLTILAFIGVLAVLVLVHELGHFLTARAHRVRVLEFGFGYPPKLLSFRKGETIYSLNLLPLGGFVKLEGEENPTSPRSLASKGLPTRFNVLIAGAAMNLLLPLAIFTGLFIWPQETLVGRVVIQKVMPNSPAALAGLKPGDRVLTINGRKIENNRDLAYTVTLKRGATTDWLVERTEAPPITLPSTIDPTMYQGKTERLTLYLVPRWRPPEGEGPTGIVIGTVNPKVIARSYPFWQAVPKAVQHTGEVLILARNEVVGWFIGRSSPQLAGPIGIAQMTGEVARAGWLPLLEFTGLLSLNLAILNVLPIPMLDGGRLLFLAIEFVRRGKRVPPDKEALVHMIGFAVLVGAVVIISYFDIARILSGNSTLR
ncbi:MAG: site-2 protease family protein [Chloroflexi bacterium]|nr:site-2 protease family protein [Chloroflexota bacterium]